MFQSLVGSTLSIVVTVPYLSNMKNTTCHNTIYHNYTCPNTTHDNTNCCIPFPCSVRKYQRLIKNPNIIECHYLDLYIHILYHQ